MIYLFLQLFLCVVAAETTSTSVVAKFKADVQYALIEALGKENIIPLIQGQIPTLFPSIKAENIIGLDISDANGLSELSVELDPETPNLASVLSDIETLVDAETSITVSTLTITTVPNSFSVINYANANPTTAPKVIGDITVKFEYLLPWAAVGLVGEDTVIDALKVYTPQYIHSIKTQSIKDVKLEERNGNVGVDMMIAYDTANIYDVLVESKEFVECGTVIRTPGQPDITLDRNSFDVLYPDGADAILTGDEKVACPGQTTTPTSTSRPTRKLYTEKPSTAGSTRILGELLHIVVPIATTILIISCL